MSMDAATSPSILSRQNGKGPKALPCQHGSCVTDGGRAPRRSQPTPTPPPVDPWPKKPKIWAGLIRRKNVSSSRNTTEDLRVALMGSVAQPPRRLPRGVSTLTPPPWSSRARWIVLTAGSLCSLPLWWWTSCRSQSPIQSCLSEHSALREGVSTRSGGRSGSVGPAACTRPRRLGACPAAAGTRQSSA